MNLGSCHIPAWAPSNPPPNSAWAAATRIRGQLCRLCDLTLEAKDSGRLSRFRYQEFKIVRALHDDFGRLDLDTAHCTSATKCDICRLMRAAKRMALSTYADEFTAFIRETREAKGGAATRVTHDFADDFRRYIMRAGLPEHSRTRQLMARAELVSQCLAVQMNDARVPPENAALASIHVIGNSSESFIGKIQNTNDFAETDQGSALVKAPEPQDGLVHIASRLALLRRDMDRIQGRHLRIIR